MGLFSSLRGKPANDAGTQIARSVLVMPLVTAVADGKLDDLELREVVNLCAQSPIFLAIGAERTLQLAKEVLADFGKRGAEAVFAEALQTLTPALCETAFCFSVRVAVADGHLDQSEKDTLSAMGSRMGIPVEKFNQILEVLGMLERPAAA